MESNWNQVDQIPPGSGESNESFVEIIGDTQP